ncbi:MAG: hypothetical protein ACIAS6_00845 [Phycisphaerales bacterium JB060]
MRPRREAKPPRRPRVITWRLVLVSLVVGVVLAVVSVGVGAALAGRPWMPTPRQTSATYFTDEQQIRAESHRALGFSMRNWNVLELGVVRDRQAYMAAFPNVVQEDPRPPHVAAILEAEGGGVLDFRAGWPLLASRGHLHVVVRGVQPGTPPPSASGGPPGLWMFQLFGEDWVVPYLPLWPGLLGNTLFYTLLVLTPIIFWRWQKLRRRTKRGLCVACGYELGEGVDACPECGLARAAP